MSLRSSGLRLLFQLVVPAKAGTHTPRPIKEAMRVGYLPTIDAGGWVPAFAGTTSDLLLERRLRRDQLMLQRRKRFFSHQFVAEHAGFFPRRLGRKAPQQDQQRFGGLPVGLAMRQHAFDHPAPQSCRAAERVDLSGFMVDFER